MRSVFDEWIFHSHCGTTERLNYPTYKGGKNKRDRRSVALEAINKCALRWMHEWLNGLGELDG